MFRIPLIKPYISDQVKQAVLEVLESGYLTEGPVTQRFEARIAEYLSCPHVLAVTSCTTGLEIALRCIGIGPGNEVIVPDYTYPATASAVNVLGATAVIVDVDPNTMLMDYDALENAITDKTRAIIPVSLFGNPLDYDRLNPIRKENDLFIIEDAACALGAKYDDIMVGNQADITVFSLHPRKFVTTGEGGLISTRNPRWAEWMHSYKHFGLSNNQTRLHASFDMIGTNAKLSNVLAAIGLAQMDVVEELLEERRRLARRYDKLVSDLAGVSIPTTTTRGKHSYQTYCVFVERRNDVMESMHRQGVQSQIGTYALHRQKAFIGNPLCRFNDCEGSDKASDTALALPMYHGMTDSEQAEVIASLAGALN